MNRVIIVQARMTSTRLPGKVMMDLAGRPMLSQQLRRLKRCRRADEIVVATTLNESDRSILLVAQAEGVRWFRGSEHDVLSRYLGAACESKADVVVRITSDCPLIDPEMTDLVIQELESHPTDSDYAANIIQRTYPRGLETEAFFRDILERLGRLATSAPAREHVTHFLLKEHPELFVVRSVTDSENNSDLRWTVDTEEDMAMIRRVYEQLGLADQQLSYRKVLAYARSHPSLAAMNVHVPQKSI